MGRNEYDFGPLDYLYLLCWQLVLAFSIWMWGWFFGIGVYIVFYNVMGRLLKLTFNLEFMTGNDEFFFMDDYRNRMNIVAYQKYEKFDYEAMARAMVSRACAFPRLKSRVKKFLGHNMLEELSDEEMMGSIKRICPAVTGIHNEKQLAEFMAKEQSTRLPLGYLQWRLFFIPDYSETESVFVYKVHHSLADGIANILMFFQLTDNPKLSEYPVISPRFGFWKGLLVNLAIPFYMFIFIYKILVTMQPEVSGLKNKEVQAKLDCLKSFALVPDISTEVIKQRAKELSSEGMRITFNDVLMAAISKSVHDYLRKHTFDQ